MSLPATAMSRQASFFSQQAPIASPSFTSRPVALSSLIASTSKGHPASLADLDTRLNEAVAALRLVQTSSSSDDIWCTSSESEEDYSSDSDEDIDVEEEAMEELQDDEEYDSSSTLSTPASSISSSSASLKPLKPALRTISSTNSAPSMSGRKCSFSDEPKICRTYSSTEYLRAGPTMKKLNAKQYFDLRDSQKTSMAGVGDDEIAQEIVGAGAGEADGLSLCRFPSRTQGGRRDGIDEMAI